MQLPSRSPRLMCREVGGIALRIFASVSIGVGSVAVASAEDRIRMVGPSPADEAIKTLASSLEAACNKRDVSGFLSLFAPKKANQIRRAVEDFFICHDISLDVHDTLLLSATDTEITFGVRYTWHAGTGSGQTIASRVTALRDGASWMLDREEILSKKDASSESPKTARQVAIPPGGQLPLQGRPAWIPADIEWVPGGCANGRCGL